MKKYCPHCNEEHVVSETYDNEGTLVGYFCNREKLLISSEAPIWDGENVLTEFLGGYVYETVDADVLARMQPDRLIALSKRIAYRIMRTDWAEKRNINFAFTTYWVNELVKRLYSEISAVTEVI
jgi:hypothetical protein